MEVRSRVRFEDWNTPASTNDPRIDNSGITCVSQRHRLARTVSGARWTEYEELLGLAMRSGYEVLSLENWLTRDTNGDRPSLILRHDVDQYPRSAMRMAAIERRMGVRSTWYFRWRTADSRVISHLRRHGFDVGFHYETYSRRVLALRNERSEDRSLLLPECRETLRDEIMTFGSLHGAIRSVCPHGDSRVPDVSNAALLSDQDCTQYGVEFDGNQAMRGRGLAQWLTDRSAPDGSWVDRIDPHVLIARRASPVLLVVHPNNWCSGLALWIDRLLGFVLPDRLPRPSRTRSDRPPSAPRARARQAPPVEWSQPPSAGSHAPEGGFADISAALRYDVARFYERRGEPLTGAAGMNTLDTNSTLVERRGRPLLAMLAERRGDASLAGLDIVDLGCGFGALGALFAFEGAAVTGVDPAGDRFEVGRGVADRFDLDMRFVEGRMEHSNLPDARFDMAIVNNSLCYVVRKDQRDLAFAEIRRLLRPGGWVVIRDPNRSTPFDPFTNLPFVALLSPERGEWVARRFGRRRSVVRLTTPRQAARELHAAGLVDVVVSRALGGPYRQLLTPIMRYHHLTARRPVES
jgi:SAM-dependent methyltransferase